MEIVINESLNGGVGGGGTSGGATAPLFEIAQGNVAGSTLVNFRSLQTTVTASQTNPLQNAEYSGASDAPSTGFVATSGGETITIVSSSANDDLVGTGAQKVTVTGVLDTAGVWTRQTEEVDMDGTTPVVTTAKFKVVEEIEVTQVGSGTVNAGQIDAKFTTANEAAGTIEATIRKTFLGQKAVVDGESAYVFGVDASTQGLGALALFKWVDGNGFEPIEYMYDVAGSDNQREFEGGLSLGAGPYTITHTWLDTGAIGGYPVAARSDIVIIED